MTGSGRFGRYQLFKSLSTDPFGETYRAGRVGDEGIERVVLLKLLRAPQLDGDAFWSAVQDREALGSILRSPNLGQGLDLGVEDGTPYLAYDYVSGRSLSQLLRQASERPFPIPIEHALFVAERIALGLAAAHQTRFAGKPLSHGFLTPDWVWLSSEGEIRILGVEVSPGLALVAREALDDAACRPYLSPEVLAGGAPEAPDDVYSLGALLFELLTGEPPPDPGAGDPAAHLERATLSSDGAAIPPPLRRLLASSLGGRETRPAAADAWHSELASIIDTGDYSPTTFNLAFFLHTLFRGDIERENEEIELEKEGKAAEPEAPAAVEAPVTELEVEPEPEPEPAEEDSRVTATSAVPLAGVARAAPEGRGRQIGWWVGGIAIAAAIAGGVYYFAFLRPPAAPGDETIAAAPGTAGVEAPQPEADPLAPGAASPEAPGEGEEAISVEEADAAAAVEGAEADSAELAAQVRELVAERTGQLETSLKQEYERRLEDLKVQLEAAREAEAERRKAAAEVDRPTAEPGEDAEPEPPAAVPEPEPTQRPAGPSQAGGPQRPAVEPARPATGQAAPDAAGQEPAGTGPARQPETTGPPGGAETAAAEPPPPREVRRGDLVEPGPGVRPPKLVRQPQPVYPPAAMRFRKEAIVQLRLLVDENGEVAEIEQVSEPSRFGFDQAAIRAARRTEWQPARYENVAVRMWIDLTIQFKP